MSDICPPEGLESLFTPYAVRGMALRNRIVMAPMTRCWCPGGVPGPDIAAYYARRAEGGVGLIISEGAAIDHPASIGRANLMEESVPYLFGDAPMAGWRAVTAAVHAAGSRMIAQLWHLGVMRDAGTGPFPDAPSVRPSGIWGPAGRKGTMAPEYAERMQPRTDPVTDGEIEAIIAGYARSAAFAIEAGFDGVEIHGAHGYLPDAFFWAETNQRDDRWGGDLARRSRFAAEVVRAVRAAIGPDAPLFFRYSQWKQQDMDAQLARTPEELGHILAPLVDAGVDVFDVSTRRFEMPAFAPDDAILADWTRRVTGVAAMAVGGVGLDRDTFASKPVGGAGASLASVRRAARGIADGEFDLIAIGRAMLQDPAWTNTVREGRALQGFEERNRVEMT